MPTIWINTKREIVKGDEEWDKLATYNNATYLNYVNLIGTSYISHIKGDPVRMLIDTIIARVNVTGRSYILHYRCDSGNTAQFMSMLIKKETDQMLSIEHSLNKREKISPSILFTEKLDAHEERCFVCGKVHFNGNWYDALTQRSAFGGITELKTKSAICTECSKMVESSL